jgi:DNA polymerase/3'-5' exonuclease PolX
MPDLVKKKFPRAVAIEVANELAPVLQPACAKLTIAGSVRRGKTEVGDLELLMVGNVSTEKDGLFDTRSVNLADAACDKLLRDGILAKRPNVNGHFAWGKQNKLAVHVKTGLPVDLFLTGLSHWFVSLVIRTGPKESNLALIEAAAKKGLKLHAYGEAGFTDRNGESITPSSEEDVFKLCGVRYQTPQQRGFAKLQPID